MDSVAPFRALFEYNRAVLDRYIRRFERMPWRAVVADRGTGHLSLRNTLVHILQVHDGWHNYVVPGRARELATVDRRYSQFDSWKKVRRFERDVWRSIFERLDHLTDRDLQRRVHAPWMPGVYTVADAMFQTSFEQAHHLGEIIGVLWQRGIEPPEMTWIDTRRLLAARHARRPHRPLR